MQRTPIVVGNWKLHNNIAEAEKFTQELAQELCSLDNIDIGVAPVFTSLATVSQSLAQSAVFMGAQTCFYETTGAWTGEVSAPMLAEAGCQFVLVGHSERRAHFGESDNIVAQKMRAVLDAGLLAIVCVGECLEERDAGTSLEAVKAQLCAFFPSLQKADLSKLVIAYEPVWAIGTGRSATPEQAQQVHAFIRDLLRKEFGEEGAGVRIQYGGSVKPANAQELMSQPDIDGALVGGAALVAQDFTAIVKACL